MLDKDTAAREARLRRKAQRHSLVLTRSRSRSTDDPSYDRWMLVRLSRRGKAHAVTAWLDLDGIEQQLERS
jgi:hypothetical protein